MNSETLAHHGIIGQKWGVRRYQNSDGSLTAEGKKRKNRDQSKVASSDSIKNISNQELRNKINRLELEQRYKRLIKDSYEPKKVNKGRKFVGDILKKSASNIAEQTTTYMLGAAVNKVYGKEIVNPKKGQKK